MNKQIFRELKVRTKRFIYNIFFNFSVPPQEPQIFEHTGMNVRGEVGPYREGSTIELTCIVRDGK
jgi:hypothetical protein